MTKSNSQVNTKTVISSSSGYKKTSLGLLPNDWDVQSVGQAFIICNNLRLPISEEIRKNMKGPYPYYGPTKIQDYINEYKIDGKYALIGEDGDHFLKWKDLSMTQLAEGKFNVNNHAHIIQGKGQSITEWFYYYFQNRELTPYLTRQGAGRYKLTKDALSKIPIALPIIKEQDKIVKILSSWDEAITKTQQLIEQLKRRNKELMKELLTGNKRVNRFSRNWISKRIGSVAKVYQPTTISSDQFTTSGYPIYGANGKIGQYSNYNHETPQVLVTCRGSSCGAVNYTEPFSWITGNAMVLNVDENKSLEKIFFYYLIMNTDFRSVISGSGQPQITRGPIEKISIKIPDNLEEQKLISKIIDTAENEKLKFDQILITLFQQKKGLMQKLLTGELRTKF